MVRGRRAVKPSISVLKKEVASAVSSHLGADVSSHIKEGSPFWPKYSRVDNVLNVSLPALKGLKSRR